PLLLTEGIWEQIRVDHGTEFCLIGKVQQHIFQYQNRTCCSPFLQNTSHCNHRIKRSWVEVNQRINYFIERILVLMKVINEIDMQNEVNFCVSWVSIDVIKSWNNHRIPGRQGETPNQ
uniref:Integrase core domain-containing protein n=1 Tax=Amphimedon queenslandica TaxID=400682 RepID=A0A1X7VFK5_AMPQE